MSIKDKKNIIKKNIPRRVERVFDMAENKLSNAIEGSDLEAPVLEALEDAEALKWYKVNLENGKSGDGSSYHIYVKKGADAINGPLCIFFSGGGVAWDKWMAKHPASSGKIMAGEPNYYWNNLRPVTQLMNIGIGITDLREKKNPFYEWNFVVITYSTGDFHIGQSEYIYDEDKAEEGRVYFHGYNNFKESMAVAKAMFNSPEKLLIAGDSAGGFAVSMLSDEIIDLYYPDCKNVSLFSDSSQLLNDEWKDIVQNVWKVTKKCADIVQSPNLVIDGYTYLYKKYGDSINYLYAGSPNDYLLSSFRNDVINHKYKTDKDIQAEYEKEFYEMLSQLKAITPNFNIHEYSFKNKIHGGGGTVHTVVRTPYFYIAKKNGKSMSTWLYDTVNNK